MRHEYVCLLVLTTQPDMPGGHLIVMRKTTGIRVQKIYSTGN